jgi:hypothetical protein
MVDERRFYEAETSGVRRSAPAALRNREPIANVLSQWLPPSGLVLEIASGTGEHAVFFAERFPALDWQPSDIHPDALSSISAWRQQSGLLNVREPLKLDAAMADWPLETADAAPGVNVSSDPCEPSGSAENKRISAVLCVNMVHISPWSASLGLLDGSSKILQSGGALILYGPWLSADMPTAPSNLAFDQQLQERDPEWGLRKVEDFAAEAKKRGFVLEQLRPMPANNLMLLFRLGG